VILTTFALGTAAGDLATEALGLGFRTVVAVGVAEVAVAVLRGLVVALLGVGVILVVAGRWVRQILESRPMHARTRLRSR
jgi:uncharacterized membrane-anchored protein